MRYLYFSLLLLLSACAQTSYYKAGATDAQYNADVEACLYEMGYKGQAAASPFNDLIVRGLVNLDDDMSHCMTYRKGYVVVVPEVVSAEEEE